MTDEGIGQTEAEENTPAEAETEQASTTTETEQVTSEPEAAPETE